MKQGKNKNKAKRINSRVYIREIKNMVFVSTPNRENKTFCVCVQLFKSRKKWKMNNIRILMILNWWSTSPFAKNNVDVTEGKNFLLFILIKLERNDTGLGGGKVWPFETTDFQFLLLWNARDIFCFEKNKFRKLKSVKCL